MDESLLARVPLFATLPRDELRYLADTLRVVAAPAGAVLCREGDYGDRCYVVAAGYLDVIKALGTPDEHLIATHGPGDVVGELSLFNRDRQRTATVRCQDEVRLWEMTRADFDAVLRRQPVLAYELARVLSNRLTDADAATIRHLQEKNRQLAQSYDHVRAAQSQLIAKEALEREVQVARQIQISILPRVMPRMPGYAFASCLRPARMVGGDFFDFIPLPGNRLGIAVGDVTDKGVPAAIFMAQARALLRAEASRADAPGPTLRRVNSHLLEMNALGLFVTVLYGVLEQETAAFRYARAGHEWPCLCRPHGVEVPVPRGEGVPLGIMDDAPVDEQVLTIPPDGALLLYSDGVTSARDTHGRRFGLARLTAALRAAAGRPAPAICDHLCQALATFQGDAVQYDDLTMVAVTRQNLTATDAHGEAQRSGRATGSGD